jgi:hypothetical protein
MNSLALSLALAVSGIYNSFIDNHLELEARVGIEQVEHPFKNPKNLA